MNGYFLDMIALGHDNISSCLNLWGKIQDEYILLNSLSPYLSLLN